MTLNSKVVNACYSWSAQRITVNTVFPLFNPWGLLKFRLFLEGAYEKGGLNKGRGITKFFKF